MTTERLSFRPSTPADAAAFYAYRRLPEVSEWLPRLSTDGAAVAERFADEDFRRRTLVIEVDGQVVGDLYLALSDSRAQAEVQDRHGRRPGRDRLGPGAGAPGPRPRVRGRERLVALCFDDLGLHRLYATCFADNTASWHLMEKLGMRREAHTVKDALHRDRGWVDGLTYALLAEEWHGRPS